MSENVVSPYFKENFYHGRDVVHKGIRIPFSFNKEEVLKRFSRNAQRIIKKGAPVTFRETKNKDLSVLRKLWFDENDSTFPYKLGNKSYYSLVGIQNDKILGGVILKRSGSHFFLYQLVSGVEGKKLQLPTLLVWEAFQRLYDNKKFRGRLRGIDVGVSYNPKRYRFFKNFAVETYNIILNKPFYVPVIRLSPFRGFGVDTGVGSKVNWLTDGFPTTILPRGNYALRAILRHLNIGKGDSVLIVKTWNTKYITGCITQTIENVGATWYFDSKIRSNTKIVLALHEFGIPIGDKSKISLLKKAKNKKIPIIEDCAWRNERVFDFSNYWFFSAQKMVDINYGGVLKGVEISDEDLWKYGCLDFVKKDKFPNDIKNLSTLRDNRKKLWLRYHKQVLEDGMTPDDLFDYESAVLKGDWVPTIYMQKFEDDKTANEIVKRLIDFGIQAGRYWGTNSVFLPIHGNISEEEVDYMFAVVRGYFNLCHEYEGK